MQRNAVLGRTIDVYAGGKPSQAQPSLYGVNEEKFFFWTSPKRRSTWQAQTGALRTQRLPPTCHASTLCCSTQHCPLLHSPPRCIAAEPHRNNCGENGHGDSDSATRTVRCAYCSCCSCNADGVLRCTGCCCCTGCLCSSSRSVLRRRWFSWRWTCSRVPPRPAGAGVCGALRWAVGQPSENVTQASQPP